MPGINHFKQLALVLISQDLKEEVVIRYVTYGTLLYKERKRAYMDLCSGLWIKKALHSVPKKSKSLTCIDNEHAAQGLRQNK